MGVLSFLLVDIEPSSLQFRSPRVYLSTCVLVYIRTGSSPRVSLLSPLVNHYGNANSPENRSCFFIAIPEIAGCES